MTVRGKRGLLSSRGVKNTIGGTKVRSALSSSGLSIIGPSAPTPVGGNGVVALFWTASLNATSYDGQYSSDGGSTWSTLFSGVTDTFYTDSTAIAKINATTGLVYYRIRSNTGSGSSPYTSSVNSSPYLLYDVPTDVDGTLVGSHAPVLNRFGNPYVAPAAGQVQVLSNQFAVKTTSGTGVLTWYMETAQRDIGISCVMQAGDGINLRYVSDSNRILISISTAGAQNFRISDFVAGTQTTRSSTPMTITPGVDYTVALTIIGPNILATVNGTNQISWTISGSYSGSLTATKHGWSLNNTGVVHDVRMYTTSLIPGIAQWLDANVQASADTWQDQSGNLNHALQANTNNQMTPVASVLNGEAIMRGTSYSIMNSPSVQPTNASFVKVGLFKSTDLTNDNNILAGSTVDGAHTLKLNASEFPESDIYASSVAVPALTSNAGIGNPETNWALVIDHAWFSNPLNSVQVSPNTLQHSLYVNGTGGAFTKIDDSTMVTSSTLSVAGLQGSITNGFVGDISQTFVAGSNSGCSAADINRLIASINKRTKLNFPFIMKQVLYIGDSITSGYRATNAGGSWCSLINYSSSNRWHLNKGQASVGLSVTNSEAPLQFCPIVCCDVPTAVVLFAGSNDICLYSQTGAQTYTSLQSLCTLLRYANPTLPILGVTMLPRGASFETERQSLCNLMVANSGSPFTLVADVRTLPMGAPGANNSSTYYADTTHPNDAGHASLYSLIYGFLQLIWG